MLKKLWFPVLFVAVLLATQTFWRDLGTDIPVGKRIAFSDTWGASMGTNGERCQAPAFGHARIVATGLVWVTLEDDGASYSALSRMPSCPRFNRTRHWVAANLRDSSRLEKRLSKR